MASIPSASAVGPLQPFLPGGPALPDLARRVLIFGIGFQLAMFIPSLMAYLVDDRLVNAINIWTKPLKFQVSLSIHMLTLIWLMPLLSDAWQRSRSIRWSATGVAFAAMAETAYIVLQSARGLGSHYVVQTPMEAAGYAAMGIGAVALVLGSFILGIGIWRSAGRDRPGFRLGAILGLTIGSALTLLTAGYLSSGRLIETGRWVSGLKNDASGLPLLGWSTAGGDLRVTHFFATHMMQVLPLLGLAADRLAPNKVRWVVGSAAFAGVAAVAATFLQAWNGRAFLAW
jgi:hypothetical protein